MRGLTKFPVHIIILTGVLSLGFALRLWGIHYALPYIYNLDEIMFVNPVFRYFFCGDCNPHWTGHPGHLLMYVIFFAFYLFYWLGHILGKFPDLPVFISHFWSDPTPFYLIARTITSLCGTISIFFVYLIGRRVFSVSGALVAALFFSLSPLHIIHSKIVRTDVPTTMFVLLSSYYLVKFLDKQKNHLLCLAAFFAGLSIAIKYTSLAIIFPLFVIVLFYYNGNLKRGDHSIWNHLIRCKIPVMILLAFLVLVGFFAGAPYVILDYADSMASFSKEFKTDQLTYAIFTPLQKVFWYLSDALRRALGGLQVELKEIWGGVLIELLALAGLVISAFLKNKRKYLYVLAGFPAAYLIIICSATIRWGRWIIPIIPFACILAGFGLSYILEILFKNKRTSNIALSIFSILLVIPAAKEAINYNLFISQTDKRSSAKEWLDANIPEDSKIAYEELCPQLHFGKTLTESYVDDKWLRDTLPPDTKVGFMVSVFQGKDKNQKGFDLLNMGYAGIIALPIDFYLSHGVDYIVITRYFKDLYYKRPDKYSNEIERYKKLEGTGELLKVFDDRNKPGPALEIYKLAH